MKSIRSLAKFLLVSAAFLSPMAPLHAADQPDPRAIVVEDVSPGDFPTTLKNLKEQLTADGWNIVAETDLSGQEGRTNPRRPGDPGADQRQERRTPAEGG
jgi:hypothetical protein